MKEKAIEDRTDNNMSNRISISPPVKLRHVPEMV